MLSADFIRSLLPAATDLTAAEISTHIPQALRDASVFSARNIYAGHIADTQDDLAKALDGKMSAAEVRGLMKLRLRKLGYAPAEGEQGTLTDLSSDARSSLVVNFQLQRASSYAKWRSDQDRDILDAFPGQEMYRAGAPKVPRDWQARWNNARSDLGDSTSALPAEASNGPFYALKNDPIWSHPILNRFGSPFPPFDYNSSMRVRNIGRRKCRALGLLDDKALSGDLLKPSRDPMDGSVTSSSAAGMDRRLVDAWAGLFGDRARVYAGRDGLPRVAVAPPSSVASQVVDAAVGNDVKATAAFGFPTDAARREISAAIGKPLRADAPFQLSSDEVRHILNGHSEIGAADIKNLPDTVKGPGRWRTSTDQEKGTYKGDAVTFVSDTGRTVCFRIASGKNDPRITLITMYGKREAPPEP